jgi:hypothetical protein
MHWFDRVSRGVAAGGVAEGAGISTRRSLLKGAFAASATAAFLPAAAGAATGAGRGREARRAGLPPDCQDCFRAVAERGKQAVSACKKASGGGRGKKKTPAQAARQAACQAKAHKKWGRNEKLCRVFHCEGGESEPVLPPPEVSGHASCPEGTARCTDHMCCANGDNCCICVNGFEGKVCCAGVIGCDCCA